MCKVFKAIAVISMVLVLSASALAKQSFNWTFRNDPKAKDISGLVRLVGDFENTICTIKYRNKERPLTAISTVRKGHEVEVIAEGPQEKECIDSVRKFFHGYF